MNSKQIIALSFLLVASLYGAKNNEPIITITQSDVGTNGYVISTPGHYRLAHDLIHPGTPHVSVITITACDCELDLAGYTILLNSNNALDSNALSLHDCSNIIIKNGIIQGPDELNAIHNARAGISCTSCNNVILENIITQYTSYALRALQCSAILINQCTNNITGNYGIILHECIEVTIQDYTHTICVQENGIECKNCTDVTFDNCTIQNCINQESIACTKCNDLYFSNCALTACGGYSNLSLQLCDNIAISECTFFDVIGSNIGIANCTNLSIDYCSTASAINGIELAGRNCTVTNCVFDSCARGISIDGNSYNITVAHCTANNCTDSFTIGHLQESPIICSVIFDHCTANGGIMGFACNEIENLTLTQCKALYQEKIGIAIDYCDGLVIEQCTVEAGNAACIGIHLTECNKLTIDESTSLCRYAENFLIEGCHEIIITDCQFSTNGPYNLEIDDISDGTIDHCWARNARTLSGDPSLDFYLLNRYFMQMTNESFGQVHFMI